MSRQRDRARHCDGTCAECGVACARWHRIASRLQTERDAALRRIAELEASLESAARHEGES